MASLTECLTPHQRNSNHSYVKEEIIISDCEASADNEVVQERNVKMELLKYLSKMKKVNLAPDTTANLKPIPQKNVIRVKNQDKETEVVDLDTYPTTNIPSILQTEELVDKNENSRPELPNFEDQEEKDFKISIATLDDYCSLLDIPDATADPDKQITECWTISDSESDATDEVQAPLQNSFESNKTSDLHVKADANTDSSKSLTEIDLPVQTDTNIQSNNSLAKMDLNIQTDSNRDNSNKFTKKIEFNNVMGEKKKLFYDVCLVCQEKQERINDVIVRNCSTCNASTSYQCLLCSVPPYKCLSTIYMHIIRTHQQNNVNVRKIQCPRCHGWYGEGRQLNDHLRRCKVEPHLLCPVCKRSVFHQKHHLKTHLITRHFDEISRLNIEKLLNDVVTNSETKRVDALKKAQLRYGGKSSLKREKPFPLNKFVNGYCPKCDELFPSQPEGVIVKECSNCYSQLILQCKECEKRCFTRNNMRLHLVTKCAKQFNSRVLQCNDCDFFAPHKNILRTHIFRQHMGEDPNNRYKCRKCDKTYKVIYDRNYHEKSCGNEKIHTCDECSYHTRYRYRYLNHVRKHLREKSALSATLTSIDSKDDEVANFRKFDVEKTVVKPEEMSQKRQLDNLVSRSLAAYCLHCKIKVPILDRVTMCTSCYQHDFVYRCKLCFFKHLDKSTVKTHIISCHAEKIYECYKNCGTKFSNTTDLNKHETICGKVFRCRYCSYAASCMDTIRHHIKQGNCYGSRISMNNDKLETVNNDLGDVKEMNVDDPLRIGEGGKIRQISNCKLSAKSKSIKKPHTYNIPIFKPMLKCSKCGSLHKNKAKLSQHEKICGQELFYCDHCSFKINVKATLESHIQSKHAARLFRGVNAFRCEHCPKVFRNYFVYYKHAESCRYR